MPRELSTAHLRESQVRLLDGQEYTFTALPFCRGTLEILARMQGGDDLGGMGAFLDACEISLRGGGYSPDELGDILDGGLVPSPGSSLEEDKAIVQGIMRALIAQAGAGGGS